MKKYIQNIIIELKTMYPNERITIENGFIGVDQGKASLKHSTYIGNAYYDIDGIIYTDYNTKKGSKKLITI